MMNTLQFVCRGIPVQTKLDRGGKNVFQSRDTKHWMSLVREAAEEAMIASSWTQLAGPCALHAEFLLLPKGRQRARYLMPTLKPDLDNLLKPVKDAITQAGVWKDDCQVVLETVSKAWCAVGAEKGTGVVGVRVEVKPCAY